MKQSKSFISHLFMLNSRRKAIMVSLMLHLGIILLLFTSPMMKNIPHPQIIFVEFPNETGLSAASPALSAQTAGQLKKRAIRNNHPVNLKRAVNAVNNDHDQSMVLEESKPVMIDEKVFSDNPSSAKERVGFSDATVADATGADHVPPASSRAGLAVGDGAKSQTFKGVAEARFGDRGAPSFLYQELPVYPMLARRLGKEGRVLLKLLIDADGKLLNVEVVEAAGYGFTEASVAAVKKSTYAPGHRDGVKVATRALLPVRFHLQ